MPTPEDDLKNIADLAYIELDQATAIQLTHDLDAIMKFVEQLRAVDTTHVDPLLHPLDLTQRLRPDQVTEANHSEQLGTIAPLFEDNLYLVPKIIDIGT